MSKFYQVLIVGLLLAATIPACHKSVQEQEPPDTGPPETEPPVLVPVTMNIHEKIGGYYLAHPALYNQTTKFYPLILFVHGGGQYGTGTSDLNKVLNEGIPKLLKEKKFPPAFDANSRKYSFIVIAPQFRNYPDNNALATMIEHAKKSYRIDSTRIYIVGFSLGGRAVCDYSAEAATQLAAIVAMAGVSSFDIPGKAKTIGQAGLRAWALHNKPDQVFGWENSQLFISQINLYDPKRQSRLTVFPDSTGVQYHDAWTKASDPGYKEDGKNIYEWMLQFRR
ncbi:MAG TPA: hypothetical protein VGD17_17985 [Chitinophagaceae bacterium]